MGAEAGAAFGGSKEAQKILARSPAMIRMRSSSLAAEILLAGDGGDVAEQFLELITGNCCAEVLAGYLFDIMGFVEDYRAIFGNDTGGIVVAFDGKVGEEQVMINDDDVAFERFWCIRVMKQRSNCGHFWPVQRSDGHRPWPTQCSIREES